VTDPAATADEFERRIRRRRRFVRVILSLLLTIIGLALVAKLFFVMWVEVGDQSMYPAVEYGSTLLCLTRVEPEEGDVVVLEMDGRLTVRRVVAGPGSTVRQTADGIEIDGQLLSRTVADLHEYSSPGSSARSVTTLICDAVDEIIGEHEVRICVDSRSERAGERIQLADDELYVRCDNRAFCARREVSEGIVSLQSVRARARWLMWTRDDGFVPFGGLP
jgi:hypothetical protein